MAIPKYFKTFKKKIGDKSNIMFLSKVILNIKKCANKEIPDNSYPAISITKLKLFEFVIFL